jgi:hypothetical protein
VMHKVGEGAMADSKNWQGKPTKGGWGEVVPGGSADDHITITNEKADVGEGFHITTDTGKKLPKIRSYFDKDGNYQGSE